MSRAPPSWAVKRQVLPALPPMSPKLAVAILLQCCSLHESDMTLITIQWSLIKPHLTLMRPPQQLQYWL